MANKTAPKLPSNVGVAVAIGAASLACGCSSESEPEPTPADAATASDGSQDALSELFQDGTPEDVASELEQMIDAGNDAGEDAPFEATPLYRGVNLA